MGTSALNNQLLDFLTVLNGAESAENAWQLAKPYMHELGASHVGTNVDPEGHNPLGVWTTPSWVQDMYRAEVYPEYDPKREHCRHNVTPYRYGREFWNQASPLPAPRRRLDEEIVSVGIRAAVALPVHAFSNGSRGFFGFATDLGADEFERMFAERGIAIHLAVFAAFERIVSLVRKEEAAAIGITERQRECLLWLSRGLRNDEIAERLGLRPVTVEFHLAKARRKLNARTREQALVKAVQLNIIQP